MPRGFNPAQIPAPKEFNPLNPATIPDPRMRPRMQKEIAKLISELKAAH
jgi:hypothetical protein